MFFNYSDLKLILKNVCETWTINLNDALILKVKHQALLASRPLLEALKLSTHLSPTLGNFIATPVFKLHQTQDKLKKKKKIKFSQIIHVIIFVLFMTKQSKWSQDLAQTKCQMAVSPAIHRY